MFNQKGETMNCDDARPILALYLDGDLQERERLRLKAHLDSCQECRQELELLEASWQMLGELDEIEPEPFYVSRFFARVEGKMPWHAKLAGFIKSLLAPRPLIPILAAASLVVVIAIGVNRFLTGPDKELAEVQFNGIDPEMVESMDVAEHFDLINELDFISDMEIIQDLDETEAS
jgi:anti-sigma factor RsiW